jgi:electron transport complex protein RnfB
MSDLAYEQLADALDRLPNGFPRTEAGIEVKILKKICSPEEAALAAQLSGTSEPIEAIAQRARLPVDQTSKRLFQLARRGMVWLDNQAGKRCFRLAPLVVGIYEAQAELMDHEFAHLVEAYMVQGGARGIMQPQPALHRVVPAEKALKPEWILPYDDVRAVLKAATRPAGHPAVRFPGGYVPELFAIRTRPPAGRHHPAGGAGAAGPL